MSKPFSAASADAAVFCADIGGSFIKFGISARSGEVEEFGKVPTPTASWDAFVDAVQGLITQYAPDYPADTPLAISTAGLVSPQTGELLATNIPAFTGRSLAADLSLALQRPVSAANDADCFALAEAYAGNAQNQPIVAGIILGTGVGGGLVINGQLVRGHGGVTGEWGHGAITRSELPINGKTYYIPRLPCACGQHGCLDILGGARGLERLHQHLNQQDRTSQQIVDGCATAHVVRISGHEAKEQGVENKKDREGDGCIACESRQQSEHQRQDRDCRDRELQDGDNDDRQDGLPQEVCGGTLAS